MSSKNSSFNRTGAHAVESLPLSPATDMTQFEHQMRKNPEQWRRTVEFLKGNDLMKLADGRHEVTDNGVYANVQTYFTKDIAAFENHRRYIDVQCAVSGEEDIFISGILDCTGRLSDYDGAADTEFFADAAQPRKVRADKDNFLILFPGEAHRPCISPDGRRTRVKKIVVKVPFAE